MKTLLMIALSCDETVAALTQTLHDVGLQTMISFDSRTVRMEKTVVVPPCPHHADRTCDCHTIILLVYDGQGQPITLLTHSQDGQAWVTLVRKTGQRQLDLEEKIIHAVTAAY